ncbi:MAG: cob(I)yrinic acid a,c-diamide adenosyltransferase [Rikenellaceae bacterium]|jgi:cob(I)alamin adenosyltransferase|nr:cob(I)yrinic acid a,c-diamide adenosyltransferase [Rikenellaceae bacterium]
MKVYTKGGDRGATSLVGGLRVSKTDLRVEAYGSVDELLATVALAADMLPEHDVDCPMLDRISYNLMTVAALFAQGPGSELPDLGTDETAALEREIDAISAALPSIDKFTLPGGHVALSMVNLCRARCRTTERRALAAHEKFPLPTGALVYLNRLSDYFYVLSRQLGAKFNVKEKYWEFRANIG